MSLIEWKYERFFPYKGNKKIIKRIQVKELIQFVTNTPILANWV
jgi:hypothetical protein